MTSSLLISQMLLVQQSVECKRDLLDGGYRAEVAASDETLSLTDMEPTGL